MVGIVLVGCVGRRDDGERSENPLESCDGYYWCDELDIELYLTRSGRACDIGGALLEPDGTVTYLNDPEAEGFWWSGNTSAFELCYGDYCSLCESEYEDEDATDEDEDENEDEACPLRVPPRDGVQLALLRRVHLRDARGVRLRLLTRRWP